MWLVYINGVWGAQPSGDKEASYITCYIKSMTQSIPIYEASSIVDCIEHIEYSMHDKS